MKKYISILLILTLILGMLVACNTNETSSSGEVSNSVSTDTSIDESDDTSSNDTSSDESSDVSGDDSSGSNRFSELEDLNDKDLYYEVTDERKISSIKSELNLYNQYVLIKNLCEGSVEIDKTVKVKKPKFEILDWFTVDFTDEKNQDLFTSPTPVQYDVYYDYGYRVTDERFKHHNDFKFLVYEIFVDELAEFYYNYYFGCTDSWGTGNDYPYSTSYPPFITADGVLYSVIEFNDYAELPERYIDLDSVKVMRYNGNFVVTARGSSVFSDGEVQAPDSDVKILIDPFRLRIADVQAVRDHIGSLETEYKSEFEKIKATVDRYCSINDIFETLNENKVEKVKNRYLDLSDWSDFEFYLCESDIFRSFTDVYDWFTIQSTIFTPSVSDLCRWYMGRYSAGDYEYSSLIAYTRDGLMVTKTEFDSAKSRIAVYSPSEDFFDKCELEIKNGQITFSYTSDEYDEENEGYLHEEVVLERLDEFGDGEYTYKIVKCEGKYIEK